MVNVAGMLARICIIPASAEYLPASHDVHVAVADDVAPAGPYDPAAHAVPLHELAPAGTDRRKEASVTMRKIFSCRVVSIHTPHAASTPDELLSTLSNAIRD